MIKAEDLRIGDLVRVNCDCAFFSKGTVCKVIQIHPERTYKEKIGVITLSYADGTDDGPWGAWCCNIEGVPLTPEILEKNGWSIEDEGLIIYVHEAHCLEVGFPPGREYVYVFIGFEKLHKFKYVHELQHILWALGLDAELKI